MRVYDRDLIRGGHYGQRSCEPHLQAEHMAAPTNAAKREESSCQLGAVHRWAQNGRGAMSDLSLLCGQERTSAISLGTLTLPMILRTRSRTSVMVSGNEGGTGMGPSSYAVSLTVTAEGLGAAAQAMGAAH